MMSSKLDHAVSDRLAQDRRIIVVTDEATGESTPCTYAQFCAANAGDPDLCDDVACLAVGFGFDVGGGAAPLFHISRWS